MAAACLLSDERVRDEKSSFVGLGPRSARREPTDFSFVGFQTRFQTLLGIRKEQAVSLMRIVTLLTKAEKREVHSGKKSKRLSKLL